MIESFEENTLTNMVSVNNYIENVILSFSGYYSSWANVDMEIVILPELEEKKRKIIIGLTNFQKIPVQSILASMVGGCILGSGQVEYGEFAQAHQLFAAKGFNWEILE